jgi:hypothetical protein
MTSSAVEEIAARASELELNLKKLRDSAESYLPGSVLRQKIEATMAEKEAEYARLLRDLDQLQGQGHLFPDLLSPGKG